MYVCEHVDAGSVYRSVRADCVKVCSPEVTAVKVSALTLRDFSYLVPFCYLVLPSLASTSLPITGNTDCYFLRRSDL